jgi:hypothetical protein
MEFSGAVVAFLGGMLVLVSQVLSFVNARLTEAKTPDARSAVVHWALQGIALALSAGGIALLFIQSFWFVTLLTASFILQVVIVVRQFASSGPVVRREEVLVLCLLFSAYAFFASIGLSGILIRDITDLMSQQRELISHLVDMLERLQR